MVFKNIRKVERRKCLCIRCHHTPDQKKGLTQTRQGSRGHQPILFMIKTFSLASKTDQLV